jgi:hypothetical protein
VDLTLGGAMDNLHDDSGLRADRHGYIPARREKIVHSFILYVLSNFFFLVHSDSLEFLLVPRIRISKAHSDSDD